jgi:hypothetical protein
MISGLLLGMVLSVYTCSLHSVYLVFLICFY